MHFHACLILYWQERISNLVLEGLELPCWHWLLGFS